MAQDYDKIAADIIKEFYPKNLKIQAIKYYREATGVGLAEAKDAVEKIFEQYERFGSAAFNMQEQKTGTDEKKSTGNTGIGVVGCTFVLIFGILMFVAAIVIALIVPKRQVEMIEEKVNAISEEDREYLLNMGCQEFITDGNYITKISGVSFSTGVNAKKKLYVFELEDSEALYLGVLSASDKFGYYTEYCKGLAFYYSGEITEDTVQTKDGDEYHVMIINRDETDALHGIPARTVEIKKKKQVKQSLLLCVPFVISGSFLCVLGGLGIKNRKR